MRYIVLFLLALGLVACQSPQPVIKNYDSADDVMKYETTTVRLANVEGTSGMSPPRMRVKATASCQGYNCTPDAYTLSYMVSNDTRDYIMTASDVRLWLDEKMVEWEDPFPIEEGQDFAVRGTFSKIDLTPDEFARLGTAEKVRGKIGGVEYTLPYSFREPFRTMQDRIQNPEEPENAAESAPTSR